MNKIQYIENSLNSIWSEAPATRPSKPLNGIVTKLFQCTLSEQCSLKTDLVGRIKTLSEEKIKYYESSFFRNYIVRFFSALSNFFSIGTFKNSGLLGLELFNKIESEARRKKAESEDQDEFFECQDTVDNSPIPQPIENPVIQAPIPEPIENPVIQAPIPKANDELVENDDSESDDEFFDCEEAPVDQNINLPVDAPNPKIEIAPPERPASPKEEMYVSLQSIYPNNQELMSVILTAFPFLIQHATMTKWEQQKNSKSFKIEFEKEMEGSHPQIPVGRVVSKKQITVTFPDDSGDNKKFIKLDGICHRVGGSWMSYETPVEGISISGEKISIQAKGATVFQGDLDTVMNLWSSISWIR